MNFKKIIEVLKREPKLVKIKKAKKIVFVGDTHGDLGASQKIISEYLKPGNKIVFLGDYVDRGVHSKQNLDFLLEVKLKVPNQIFLLQGNHEGYPILKFSPANFWESLDEKESKIYWAIFQKFPLVATAKNIIALHGVLPNVKDLEKINQIKLGNERWREIVWGDFVEIEGEYQGINPLTGRPQFGMDWFFKLMKRFKKEILIRSHDPYAPQFMFDNKCLTIFTSSIYERKRTVAILDFKPEIKTAKDLEIITI